MRKLELPNWNKRTAAHWRELKRRGYGGGVRQFLRDYAFQCVACARLITRVEMHHLGLCALCRDTLRSTGSIACGAGCAIQRVDGALVTAPPIAPPVVLIPVPPQETGHPETEATRTTQMKLPCMQ